MASIPRPSTPIDETLWRDPAWYRANAPLTAFNVMSYFTQSPFYDRTSNNGVLFQQMQFNLDLQRSITSPEAFNARLKTMTGVEFMVAAGSSETQVWVIRKQQRRQPRAEGVEDVTVLATYYIAGENVYQAPSVVSVLQSRMLTTIGALRSALKIATEISSFAPTTKAPTTNSTQSSQTQHPSSQPQSQNQPPPSTQSSVTASQAVPSTLISSKQAEQRDAALLQRALNLALKHQNEYMDDHAPLLGDPGSLLHRESGSSSQQTGSQGSTSSQVAGSRGGTATPQGGKAMPGQAAGKKGTPAPSVAGVKRPGSKIG